MTALKKAKSHPFKIYADFGSNLECVKSHERFYSKKC